MSLTIYDELEQGTPEWIAARAGIVTASTVGKLLTAGGKVAANDTSRTLTETLLAERITGNVDLTPPTRDMQRGILLEPFSRALYSEHFAPVTEVGFGKLETDTFTLGASPDGLVGDDGGWESKSPRAKTHLRTIIEDRVPAQYMAQVQTCLLVFGRSWWDFTSYVPGMPLYVKRVLPDPAWQEAIIAAAETFETAALAGLADYADKAQHYPPTPYFDPFEEEDIE